MQNTSSIATPVTPSSPRETVRLTLPDNRIYEAPVGTTIEQFLIMHQQDESTLYSSPFIAAVLDNRLRELTQPVTRDGDLTPVLLTDGDGARIYRRSLVLLLVTAINELYPNLKVDVSYAVPDGGYYCLLRDHAPFNETELAALETHMRAIVTANNPITRRVVPLEEAQALFESRNETDKVRLLEIRTRPTLTLYTLRERSEYYYGYMVPSTGYLAQFRLIKAPSGFILQYPTRVERDGMPALIPNMTKVGAMFEATETFLQRIGVEDIGRLNQIVAADRVQELILVGEALHEQRIAQIAHSVYLAHHDRGLRLVLISGPSSSGKTTFSKRLAIQLLAFGLRPFTLELDNYFVDRELTPLDEEGNYDFEALEAINLPLFNQHLVQLTRGEEVILPRFNFKLGKSMSGAAQRLTDNQILIIEGIHGMNPRLVTQIENDKIYRVYVSALTQLNLDSHNRIPTTDVRLLRRICRDAVQRGHNAQSTIERWPSVRRGEHRNIFPYQENADVIFNSMLPYELAALRPIAEPLLLQVEYTARAQIESNRLLSFLRWVRPMTPAQTALIPDTSLLREFVGGSILEAYQPGDLDTRDVR